MLLDAIAAYLQAQGVGTVGTDIFKGNMPDSPDSCVALYEYGGQEPVRNFSATAGQAQAERPSFQVCVRSAPEHITAGAYTTMRTKMQSIFAALDGYGGTLSGVVYHWIGAVSSPAFLKRDENGRAYLVCDFDVIKQLG